MIAATTCVYVWLINTNTGQRNWITSVDLKTNGLGQKVLVPLFDDDQHFAAKFEFQYALIMRRRLNAEGVANPAINRFFFSLSPSGEEVASEDVAGSSITKDGRVPMGYRGLLAVPGFDTRTQQSCWYIKFPHSTIESVRGSTPEEAINKAYERGPEALKYAERAAPEAPPEEPKKEVYAGPMLRPGDRFEETKK
jgi:hypothetical protein